MASLFLRQTRNGQASPEMVCDVEATGEKTPAKALVFKLQAYTRAGWTIVRNERTLIEVRKTFPDGTVKQRIYEVR